jgi:Whi5 like
MTRVLQNRLALANVKIKNGWGTLPLETIEPRIEQELKRKRPSSSSEAFSDTASTTSDRLFQSGAPISSPLTAPFFTDELPKSGSSRSSKRSRYQSAPQHRTSNSHNRTDVGPSQSRTWKKTHRLLQSSPGYQGHTARFTASHQPSLSFVSEVSTVPDEPLSPSHSEEDDSDLPLHSFAIHPRQIRSSPPRIPRTPSPDVARSARLRSKPFNASSRNEDAADLLMFLAASPSPAVPGNKSRMNPPSTPPQKTPLPSSMMSTPGGGGSGFIGFGAATPGMGFNFADYLNVTPSPAQAAWRTPGPGKTPIAAREARRRLNFDTLMPPSNGASGDLHSGDGKVNGLGMELGGELVSSQ